MHPRRDHATRETSTQPENIVRRQSLSADRQDPDRAISVDRRSSRSGQHRETFGPTTCGVGDPRTTGERPARNPSR